MRLQMIQEMRVEESFKNIRQNTSESYRSIVKRIRAATLFRDRLNKCTLKAMRKSISIKAKRVELNANSESHSLRTRGGMPSGPLTFLTFIDFRIPCS